LRRGALYRADGALIVPRAWKASNAWDRMRGLLGRPPLARDEALLIERCASVHTLGMRYALDVAFLDAEGRVVKLSRGLKPLRFAAAAGARDALELAAGAAETLGIVRGAALRWREQA